MNTESRIVLNGDSPEQRLMVYLVSTGEVFGRCERIRTSDPFVPNEVRYQAAPHTDNLRPDTIPKARGRTNITTRIG
jgi:hypothetical protein